MKVKFQIGRCGAWSIRKAISNNSWPLLPDIDLLIDTTGTAIKSLLQLAEVYCALETALGKPVDVITISSLEQKARMPSEEHFCEQVRKERVELYAVA